MKDIFSKNEKQVYMELIKEIVRKVKNISDADTEINFAVTSASFLLVVFIGIVDFLTGYEFGFSLFYLFPIVVISWGKGGLAGCLMAILSAGLWTAAHSFSGLEYSHGLIPFWNLGIRMLCFLIVIFMIRQLKAALQREKTLARHDALTGVANPSYFKEYMVHEIQRCRRYKRPLVFTYIDCDNFKKINDTFGHGQGDDVLRLVAQTIQQNIRSTDFVARLGGDEFIVVFPETIHRAAKEVIVRLQECLLDTMKKHQYSITFSIGIATFESMLYSLDEMVNRADVLMYEAKTSGKNNIKDQQFRGLTP